MAVAYGMCGGAEENTKPVEAEVDLAEPRRTMSSTLDVEGCTEAIAYEAAGAQRW